MNVYYDYQIFYLQKYGGISRYFYELTKELNEIQHCAATIIAPYHQNEYLLNTNNKQVYTPMSGLVKKIFYNQFIDKRLFINEYAARQACKKNTSSILHETYYTHRFKVKAPRVTTVHDMIYELFSSHSPAEKEIIKKKKQAIFEADSIIAVSQNTKKDLISLYPEVKNKVQVIYHGISGMNTDSIKTYQNEKPYILFVGNRDWYKNFEKLLQVYCENKQIHSEFDLICFGGHAFTSEELSLINSSDLNKHIKRIEGSDSTLNQLYKGASVLAYLSKYEGFGLPVLEAFRFGCSVICSKGSSLPEVGGNLAQSINVDEKNEIEKALMSSLFGTAKEDLFATQAKNWASNFTWRKCALETHKVYSSLLEK